MRHRYLFLIAAVPVALLATAALLTHARDAGSGAARTAAHPRAESAANAAEERPIAAVASAPAASAGAASLAPAAAPHGTEPARTRAALGGHAGMVLTLDPESGRFGMPEHAALAPSIEELQALVRQEAATLVTLRSADGSERIEHEGRFTDYTVVRFGADGKAVFECAHGEAGIRAAMHRDRPTGLEER